MDLQAQDLRIHANGLSVERDSLKDETVVFVFIIATAGLLLWAFVKLYVQKWLVVRTAPVLASLILILPALIFR